jgi:hypothetical protein
MLEFIGFVIVGLIAIGYIVFYCVILGGVLLIVWQLKFLFFVLMVMYILYKSTSEQRCSSQMCDTVSSVFSISNPLV